MNYLVVLAKQTKHFFESEWSFELISRKTIDFTLFLQLRESKKLRMSFILESRTC
jgi:hypothetical protein